MVTCWSICDWLAGSNAQLSGDGRTAMMAETVEQLWDYQHIPSGICNNTLVDMEWKKNFSEMKGM